MINKEVVKFGFLALAGVCMTITGALTKGISGYMFLFLGLIIALVGMKWLGTSIHAQIVTKLKAKRGFQPKRRHCF